MDDLPLFYMGSFGAKVDESQELLLSCGHNSLVRMCEHLRVLPSVLVLISATLFNLFEC